MKFPFFRATAENRTDALIDELMKHSAKSCDPQKVLEELERERREMEEMFTVKAGEEEKLRQEEVKSTFPEIIFFSEILRFYLIRGDAAHDCRGAEARASALAVRSGKEERGGRRAFKVSFNAKNPL